MPGSPTRTRRLSGSASCSPRSCPSTRWPTCRWESSSAAESIPPPWSRTSNGRAPSRWAGRQAPGRVRQGAPGGDPLRHRAPRGDPGRRSTSTRPLETIPAVYDEPFGDSAAWSAYLSRGWPGGTSPWRSAAKAATSCSVATCGTASGRAPFDGRVTARLRRRCRRSRGSPARCSAGPRRGSNATPRSSRRSPCGRNRRCSSPELLDPRLRRPVALPRVLARGTGAAETSAVGRPAHLPCRAT